MVCLAEDEYVRELQDDRATAVWLARLSDGTTAYMDDGRPGAAGSAWLRLKAHCESCGIKVAGLHIKFRSNLISFPANAEGYFFCRSAVVHMNSDRHENYYLVGQLSGDKVVVQRWLVPELIYMGEEVRDVGKCEFGLVR